MASRSSPVHQHASPDLPDELDNRHRLNESFAEAVLAGRQQELVGAALGAALDACAGRSGLSFEIGALRLVLERVIATELLDGNTRELSQTITRLVDTLLRALRLEQALATSLKDDIYASIARVFAEQGLLEDQ